MEITPGKLLTTDGKTVKVLDLGMTRLTGQRATPSAGDLHSLGRTFYELLAGRPPDQEPLPIEQVRPDVPAGVAGVVARLLAKEPEDGFRTPTEVVAALFAAWASGGPETDQPQLLPDEDRGPRAARRHAAGLAARRRDQRDRPVAAPRAAPEDALLRFRPPGTPPSCSPSPR